MLISRTAALLEAGVGDEIFALDVDGGHCFGFNDTATEIWRTLETPTTFADLCDALLQSRDVDRATCVAETSALLARLAEEKLVELTPP